MKVILSPCLYMKGTQDFCLFSLTETLMFIYDNLIGGLDDYEKAFYNQNRFYQPPVTHYNDSYLYQKTFDLIRKLVMRGEIIADGDFLEIIYSIFEKDYSIVDDSEFQIMCNYLNYLFSKNKLNDVIMFTGEKNKQLSTSKINIKLNDEVVSIPVVKDVWEEETDIFNLYINPNSINIKEIFPNKNLLNELYLKFKRLEQDIEEKNKPSFYKHYGNIFALRNNYKKYHIDKPYVPETNYYRRYDEKYIISIDLLHGTFEVFNGNDELWIAEYKFSGDVFYEAKSKKELNELRQKHKVRRN